MCSSILNEIVSASQQKFVSDRGKITELFIKKQKMFCKIRNKNEKHFSLNCLFAKLINIVVGTK